MKVLHCMIPIAVAVLAGCQTTKPQPTATVIRVEEPQGQAVVTPAEPTTPFRTPERVAVYTIGRTRDAVDPNVLHLEHQVVRVERPAGWIKLEQGQGTHVQVTGPEDPLGEKAAEPRAADLELKVNIVSRVMEQLDERNKVLVNKLDGFAKATEEAGRLKEENGELRAVTQELRNRLDRMDEDRKAEKARADHERAQREKAAAEAQAAQKSALEQKPWWKIW